VSPFVSSIEVNRSPDEVFAYVTDPARFAEWQGDVVSVRVEAGGPGVGSRFTTVRRIGGAERSMTQEVTEVDRPRRWAVRGVDGPIRPSSEITIEPLPGAAGSPAGSRVTFALDFEGHGMGVALVPMVRRLAAKDAPTSYRRLKERLESTAGTASGPRSG
jgi:uncharacterized protein YndB with AHSA1/START domain